MPSRTGALMPGAGEGAAEQMETARDVAARLTPEGFITAEATAGISPNCSF